MILGLYTELLSPGGVQRVGRQTAAVLKEFAETTGRPCHIISLNDPPGAHEVAVGETTLHFVGFGRRKWPFIQSVLTKAPWLTMGIMGHPNLAPLGLVLRMFKPTIRCAVIAHGIEVWAPLPRLVREGLKRCTVVIVPSRITQEKVQAFQNVPSKRIRKVSWGLDPDFRFDDQVEAHEEYEKHEESSPDSKVLLTVTRLDPNERYKGVEEVIAALPEVKKEIERVRYVIIGGGDDIPRLRSLAEALGLSDQVTFLGRVTQEELLRQYRLCDAFIMPSRAEGFGFVHVEAMAYGKPVIAANEGATPEIISHGEHGFLVDPDDKKELAGAMIEILRNDELRRRMGRQARQRVMEYYAFPRFKTRFSKVLQEL